MDALVRPDRRPVHIVFEGDNQDMCLQFTLAACQEQYAFGGFREPFAIFSRRFVKRFVI
jgi:hypothetical protein